MALPRLETIEVDSPPFSPISFADDSFNAPSVEDVASPVKRTRSIGNFTRSKRQKKDDAPSFDQVSNIVPQYTHDADGELPDVEIPRVDDVSTVGYSQYIAAVEGKVAGFYPLSDDLFIVQGWDDKFHCVKVSLVLC
jgi:hypothetical protein